MFIIKAVILLHLCHLTICQFLDPCSPGYGTGTCTYIHKTSTLYPQLKVGCSYRSLNIYVSGANSTNPFDGSNSTNFPSLNILYNECRYGKQGLDDPKVSNDSFYGLEQLEMKHCQIKELEIDAFSHLKSIRVMEMSDNHISVLPIGVFRQQQNVLRRLHLNNNRLNSSSFAELKSLKRLETLGLSGNRIEMIPDGVFNQMTQLIDLQLGNNLLKSLQGAFTGLRNLIKLDLDHNFITEIRYDDFKHLDELQYIKLDNNVIRTIEDKALINSVNIDRIDLSNNSLSTVPNITTKIPYLIYGLDLSHNNIEHIKLGIFDDFKLILYLDLSYNRLTDITNVFRNTTIRNLNLDHNRLTRLSFNDIPNGLDELSISHNHIHTIEPYQESMKDFRYDNAWFEKTLNLSHNRLSELKNLSLPTGLNVLEIDNNNISFISYSDTYISRMRAHASIQRRLNLKNNAFKVFCQHQLSPRPDFTINYYLSGNPLSCSCENHWLISSHFVIDKYEITCQIEYQRLGEQPWDPMYEDQRHLLCNSDTSCSCNAKLDSQDNGVTTNCNVKCPTQCKCYNNAIKSVIHVDCSSSNIDKLPLTPTAEFNITQEIYVYLDNNSISTINSNSFDGLNGTTELYLNWNGLSEIADGSFDHLTVLNVLHLEHNNLRHVSENMFKKLNSLRQLFLSHNRIQTIEPNAFPSQLYVLHLDNNQLFNYSIWQLDNVTDLSRLSLHGNQWSCEYNFNKKFRNWLANKDLMIESRDGLWCDQSKVTEHQLPSMIIEALHLHDVDVSDLKNMLKLLLKYLFN